MIGFLRLTTSSKVVVNPKTNTEAWAIYQELRALPNIQLLDEPGHLEFSFLNLTIQQKLSHRMWTDAYLAAFAIAGCYRLVSFDSDFARFPNLNFLHLKP
jgi:uncharacterized protein